MMARRKWPIVLLFVVAAMFSTAATAADPFTPPPALGGKGLGKSFDLQKQLETGLKARRPGDFVYIKKIVFKVENGSLPRGIVDQAFLYARSRNSPYPIVYFQASLAKLAQKAGTPL